MITAEQWWLLHKDHVLIRPIFPNLHPSILRFPGKIGHPGTGTMGSARCPKCGIEEVGRMRPAKSYEDLNNYEDRA